MDVKKKILIIDDEQQTQDLMSDVLSSKGYTLYSCVDSKEGLSLAREKMPDLILLDVMMPEMDGFKVQQLLNEDEKTKKIPVVFITARVALEDTIQAVTHGAAGYIEKPFDVKRLLRKIESLLEKA